MARIRSLKPEFWDDRKLARSVCRDARMLYLGLWNQADEHGRCNGDGQWLKGRVFPYDDDVTPDRVVELLRELAAGDWVVGYAIDGDPFLYLPKLAKHQRLEPAKVASRHPAPDDPRATQIFSDESAPRAGRSALLYVAGSMDQGSSSSEIASDSDADEPTNDPADPPREDVERICRHLADRIESNGSKRPRIGRRWRDAARLMLDADGRTEEQIHTAIDWCQADQFWRGNVLSLPKLREKYDQLRLAAQRKRPGTDLARASPSDAPGSQAHFQRAMERARAKEAAGDTH